MTITVLAILNTLEAGEWITLDEIALRCRVPRREIEESIQELRLQGHAVVGGSEGVKLSTDPDEIRQYAQGRRRRLVSIALGTRALLRAARRLDTGQPTLGL